jgi:hypothetical protein
MLSPVAYEQAPATRERPEMPALFGAQDHLVPSRQQPPARMVAGQTRAGRANSGPGEASGPQPLHPSSTANIAALAVHSLGLTSSQVFNAADPDCPTVSEIANYVATAMNHTWRIVPVPNGQSTGSVGDTPWTAEHPVVLDTSRGACRRV